MTILNPGPMMDYEEAMMRFAISAKDYDAYQAHCVKVSQEREISQNLTWNPLIIALYGVEGSEHCAYMHTKDYIKRLTAIPSRSKFAVVRGDECSGVLLPNDFVLVFKIESHNHPSAIEPYEGAATGVGGIVRDIFAMGARPTALLDGLYFGRINRSTDPRQDFRAAHSRSLFRGVVAGVGGYGNCLGLPNAGGQLFFSDSYSGNPLVNVWAEGMVKQDKVILASTAKPGYVILTVGNTTGADGVGGASVLASHTFEAGDEDRRPTVQVGDPYTEKRLFEAWLEANDLGLIAAGKDMGAAGLTCTTTEMCDASNVGMDIDLDFVPLRETPMEAHVCMMSESQERMLIAASPENVAALMKIFVDKWGLYAAVLGRVDDSKLLRLRNQGELIGVGDPFDMVGRPSIPLEPVQPVGIEELWDFDFSQLEEPENYSETLLDLLSSPNIASARWVYRQYDHQVGTDTVVIPGRADAVVMRVKGEKFGTARTMDCNPRYCYLDPEQGAMIAVAEAVRNLACVGAEPAAASDGLNFGNPERNDVAWQMVKTFDGLEKALTYFGIPIVSGNASLYNESDGAAIWPTPTIGMVGVLDDVTRYATAEFKKQGDSIYLVGPSNGGELGGSEFLSWCYELTAGRPPKLDLIVEKKMSDFIRSAVQQGMLASTHDCSMGGLLVNIAEKVMSGRIGAEIFLSETNGRIFFGESQSRFVVSVSAGRESELENLARQESVPLQFIGVVGGDDLVVKNLTSGKEIVRLGIQVMTDVYEGVFPNMG